MIDKLQPRKLDKDTDQKLVQKNSMVDALNVYIDENLSGESGDAGVIKPIRGTSSLEFHSGDARPEAYEVDASTWRVLGSVTDEITEVVYFFCWSEDANEQGVYAWDRKGVLPYVDEDDTISSGTVGSVRKIFADPIFNFNPNSFVSADVVYTLPSIDRGQTGLPDNDVIIYFTDNNNEPRKLNVYRTLFSPGLSSRSNFNKNDYICACPKVPMGNIDFVFESDIAVNVSNFDTAPGFQFAIQGVYYDGTHTAIGPYSDIAFPPSVVNRGSKAVADTLQHNLCKIFIPTLPKEIKNISILARQGNSANFIELAEVPNLGASVGNWVNEGGERHYKFYNNEISVGVSPSEVSKIFDAVPRKAKSQVAINNRLIYGNFVEGYKPTQVGASLTPVFRARPSEGVDFSIGAIPSIVKHRGGHASGIEIDVSEIPDAIDEGTVVEFAFAFAPNQNFHVYNNRSSYSQTHMRGAMAGDLQGYPTSMGTRETIDGPRYTTNTASTTAFGTPARNQEYRTGEAFSRFTRYATRAPGSFPFDFEDGATDPESMFVSGNPGSQQGPDELTQSDAPSTRNFFGFNYGVGVRHDDDAPGLQTNGEGFPSIGTPQYSAGVDWQYENGSGLAAFGTSAAAPLIIQGGQVSFRVKFKVLEDIQFGARESISDFVSEILTEGVGTDDRFEADIVERTYQHDVGLDLIDGQQLSPSQRKLITAVADIDNGSGAPLSSVDNLGRAKRIPIGYFILNRASVHFSLKKSDKGPDVGGHSRNALNLCIDDVIVPQDGIYTCLRKADPGSPWWAVSPDTIDASLDSGNDITGGWSNWAGQIFSNTEGNSFSFQYDRRQDDGSAGAVSVGSRFVGRLKWSGRDTDAKDFWQNKVEDGDVDGFKFCLLDGAGGPGGFSPGNDSAFNNYGNADQGSITGQVLFTHYGTYLKANSPDSIDEVKKDVLEDVYNMCTWTQAKKNSIGVGGVLFIEDNALIGDSSFSQMNFGGVGLVKSGNTRASNMGLPTVSDINEATGSGPTANKNYPVLAMFTGPFFTGKIGMHPVVSPTLDENDYQEVINQAGNGSYNIANPQNQPYGETDSGAGTLWEAYDFLNGARIQGGLNNIESEWLPPQVTQTTTLPYVLFNDVPIELRDDIPLFSLTFPVPILDQEAKDEIVESTSYEERYTINIPLNPNPFGASTEVVSTSESYDENHIGFSGISLAGFNPHVEVAYSKTISSGVTGKPLMSFKSNATHEFGVVYFDERGRRGPVSSLGSVYVPGYSTQERGPAAGIDGGPTFVNVGFNSAPPSWAHHYKIVYSKNTSVSDFFQYTTEGAYAVVSDQSDNNGTKIYMSLNYLQGHPISYSDAWGAKSQDGSPVVFQPKQGDKLRVISYNVIANGDQRKVFPNNVIFDVVGVESLSGDVDANPLLDQSLEIEPEEQEAYNSKQGLFLVLRDNPENEGFSAANIKANSSEWFNNVVFEIYRPIKSIEADKRIYYEIGPTYRVGYTEASPNELKHLNELGEDGSIEMSQGDVFFRLTPLNYKDIEGDSFVNLIREPEQTSAEDDLETVDFFSPESEPNFVGIYTEANSASDLFESDSKSIGRPAKIDRNDTERRREASLIHSDRDVPKKRKLGYSSFNPSQADDKDVDPTGGPINFMKADKDSIIVLQKNKTSSVPVDRNIISTADNEVSLVASSNVLGTPRYYAAEGGTDSPESVASSTDATYFASKSMGKVFRFSASNGVMDISAKGMKAFFRDLFSKLSSSGKIIGGFDPKKEEYLVTVRDDASQLPNGSTVSQGDEPAQVFGESPGSDISIDIFEGGTPEGLEGDQRFTSQAIVFESQFYRPCCVDGDPFYPVRFAIDAIAAEGSDSFTITEDIISYLEYALGQIQNNEDFRLRAGTLNSVITQSVRAQGYPGAEVAPFSPSTGDNLAVAFLESCGEETDPNRIYNANQLQSWATSEWGAPSAYTPIASGTGFASVQFILDVSEELRRDVNPLCSITYNELWARWKNSYALGSTLVPWEEDGTMDTQNGNPSGFANWSVERDGGGIFPARVDSATKLAALLSDGTPGLSFDGADLQLPSGIQRFGIPTSDLSDVLGDFYVNYIAIESPYPLALFQVQQELREALADYLGVDVGSIPGIFRVNGTLLKTWESVQEGAPQEEGGGGGAD